MSDTSTLGLSEAARRLHVPIGVLRRAMRTGRIPRPPHLSAVAPLPAEWFDSVQAALEASPKALGRNKPQKVPAFARYEGTSAWRKYKRRVHEHARFRAASRGAGSAAATPAR